MRKRTTFILAGTLAFGACNPSQLSIGVRLADRLITKIGDYNSALEAFDRAIGVATAAAEEPRASNPVNHRKVAEQWERRWGSVHERYGELRERFDAMTASSQRYFQQLDQIAAQVVDERLKAAEMARNQRIEDEWSQSCAEASQNLARLERLLIKGDDLSRVLAMNAIRSDLQVHVGGVRAISRESKQLIAELERLLMSSSAALQLQTT
ncbi:MAG TPA: hypothetical protein VF142_02260 [Longimicrobium sp.]